MPPTRTTKPDVLIIGASASGLMCAIEAAKRGRNVTVLDHANKAGKKILMSGGGRCNFTNLEISPENYISQNPHFCKSALSRYTQWDFIAMVDSHHIPWHERDEGKLFCNESAKDILDMLLGECHKNRVDIQLDCEIQTVKNDSQGFIVKTSSGNYKTKSLVVASGGLSIPKMCATPFGYRLAEQFGHTILPTRAGLVPFTLQPQDKDRFAALSGVSVDSVVSNSRASFKGSMLFTHRGLSGPAILQISSYWQSGEKISINLWPETNLADDLKQAQKRRPNSRLKTVLTERLPKRLLAALFEQNELEKPLQELSQQAMQVIADRLQQWELLPAGTEGYRTAEVTIGGVNTDELSSKTMESKKQQGLYFIGEVVDVAGWLGGYNFQWAWSSGWCAGQVV